MLKVSDFVYLPYTTDLTEGAIAYTLHLTKSMIHFSGKPFYDQMRRKTANTIVELAFRRYLSSHEISFDVQSAMPFTDPGRYNVMLGRRRCDIKSYLITNRKQIGTIKHNPGILMDAPALVPSDKNATEGHSEQDIYLFVFVTGFATTSQTDLYQAVRKKLPTYLLHIMPDTWSHPKNWHPLGKMVLKSESTESQIIRINGQDEGRELRSIEVTLLPHTRVEVSENLFSILYIYNQTLPDARVGVYTSTQSKAHIINPADWGNIWVYGIEIVLAGWITHKEFNHRAKMLHEGAKVFQYSRTRTKNVFVHVHELNPISTLLERTMDWSK